jgi:hypothetical protein
VGLTADLDPSDMMETSTHVFKRDVHKCRVPHPLRFVQRVRVLILTIRRRLRRKFLSGILADAHAYDAAMSTAKENSTHPTRHSFLRIRVPRIPKRLSSLSGEATM